MKKTPASKPPAAGTAATLAPAPEKKKWSGTWVEKETTRKDNVDGGRVSTVYVRANQSDEIAKLEALFLTQTEVNLLTADGKTRGYGTILEKTTKVSRKNKAESVLTLKLEGPGSFASFVGRNVVLDGRQRKLPIGEEQGEPR